MKTLCVVAGIVLMAACSGEDPASGPGASGGSSGSDAAGQSDASGGAGGGAVDAATGGASGAAGAGGSGTGGASGAAGAGGSGTGGAAGTDGGTDSGQHDAGGAAGDDAEAGAGGDDGGTDAGADADAAGGAGGGDVDGGTGGSAGTEGGAGSTDDGAAGGASDGSADAAAGDDGATGSDDAGTDVSTDAACDVDAGCCRDTDCPTRDHASRTCDALAHTCSYDCDTDYVDDAGTCIHAKQADCVSNAAKPAHSRDVDAKVTVTYSSEAGGWSEPSPCAWECVPYYTTSDAGTSCVAVLRLFSAGQVKAILGGRAGAEAKCAAKASSLSLPYPNVHAFISVDADDEIRDMPANYGVPTDLPIGGPTAAVTLATSWADLLDGTIAHSLWDAGVMSSYYWYSGSTADGAVTAHTCTNWTANGVLDGTIGLGPNTDGQWITGNEATCVVQDYDYDILCLNYPDP